MPVPAAASATLAELADACGVATSYTGADGRRVDVPADTVRAVLAAMDVPAAADEAGAALERVRAERTHRTLPASIVAWRGHPSTFRVEGLPEQAAGTLMLEDGSRREVAADRGLLTLPEDLPTGYHHLVVGEEDATLVVTPGRCPLPAGLQRQWGWMLQLYALRSAASWGMGELGDLRDLAAWSGHQGAGMVLCNPLHAATPVRPIQPSPYYPSSRRFTDPLYLRVEDVAELTAADAHTRARVSAAGARLRARNRADRIDRDAVFGAKMDALEHLFAVPRSRERQAAFAAYRRREGQGLEDFATFCALAERHGTPFTQWPAPLRHPAAPGVAAVRDELEARVEFHTWLQWLCDEQLAAAQHAAVEAGMAVGVVHDLAVGVDPGGADGWALQDDLAAQVTVGAPPDAFNQQGQDWGLPPLRPDRLAATGYAALRDMLRGVLRHAGGIRVDHVLGLFRLYWIPRGAPADAGTYVRYPASDLLGILCLEAQRAGAIVVGEDLGTVEQGVRDRLRQTGVLGSRVLYFERTAEREDADEGDVAQTAGGSAPLPSAQYPQLALSTVTTHDLPTAAGWWSGATLRVQAELGLLGAGTDLDAELAAAQETHEEMIALLRAEGLLGEDPDRDELVVAMHAFLARTPSLLVAAGLGDALGDPRQPNLPGTIDEYPNWRLPIAAPTDEGLRPVLLDELYDHPGVGRLTEALRRR